MCTSEKMGLFPLFDVNLPSNICQMIWHDKSKGIWSFPPCGKGGSNSNSFQFITTNNVFCDDQICSKVLKCEKDQKVRCYMFPNRGRVSAKSKKFQHNPVFFLRVSLTRCVTKDDNSKLPSSEFLFLCLYQMLIRLKISNS